MTSSRAVLGILLGSTLLHAQPAQDSSQGKRVSLRIHDEDTSRAAFRACDADADDRLSVFEARQCLERMGSLEDPEGFRQLDTDRNGQLSWPEFDRQYRAVCARGGSFRIRPVRPFQRPRSSPRGSTSELAALAVLELGDKNQDSVLDRDELQAVLIEFRLPESAGKQGFRVLDTDRSGAIEQKELLLLVQALPGLMDLGRQAARSARDSGGPLGGADEDHDGRVTRRELDRALRLLHPSLARWSDRVFTDADADKNGALTGSELAAATRRK